MPTSQDMHKMVAAHPMTQANLFMLLDALTHQHVVCVRNVFLGRRKYDPCCHWQREPPTEDDFASTGDFGVAGVARGVVKALEARGRGFANGHEKIHSEPQTKAIDLWDLITLKCCRADGDSSNDGASEHSSLAGAVLDQWMRKHMDDCLLDATTKQYDSSIECGRQFGIPELKEVFTQQERLRCRLDGGCEEDGRQRELVEVVPVIEPAHLSREREAATAEGRPLCHAYREVALTGAPGARHPSYLLLRNCQCFAELGDCGHASETLHPGAPEHGCPCETGWLDLDTVYVLDSNCEVCGLRGSPMARWGQPRKTKPTLLDIHGTMASMPACVTSSITPTIVKRRALNTTKRNLRGERNRTPRLEHHRGRVAVFVFGE